MLFQKKIDEKDKGNIYLPSQIIKNPNEGVNSKINNELRGFSESTKIDRGEKFKKCKFWLIFSL